LLLPTRQRKGWRDLIRCWGMAGGGGPDCNETPPAEARLRGRWGLPEILRHLRRRAAHPVQHLETACAAIDLSSPCQRWRHRWASDNRGMSLKLLDQSGSRRYCLRGVRMSASPLAVLYG